MEEWTKAIDEGHPVDVIYLDIAKAFDTVPHKRLKHKMRLIMWFGWESIGLVVRFLEQEKKMRVCVKEAQSEWRDVTSSVPQDQWEDLHILLSIYRRYGR